MRYLKKKYFKAIISFSTEEMYLNKQGEYEGYDGDSWRDHGVIETIISSSFDEFLNKIKKAYLLRSSNSELPQVFENRIEWDCEGEYHYNTNEEEQIPFREIYSMYISLIEEIDFNDSELEDIVKQLKHKGDN